jgi:DNA-binding beta-propeller fold protein YncE
MVHPIPEFARQKRLIRCLATALLGWALVGSACGKETATARLVLDSTIALPNTPGRIDHLAIDFKRQRLFVVELGNGSVDVVDLASGKVFKRLDGLDEPQGAVYASATDRLLVACGGDGTVRVYDGENYTPRGIIKLDDDADNMRLDSTTGHVLVGHGSGGLAVIDPAKAAVVADVALPAHPEAFEVVGTNAYINVPDAREIDVVDLTRAKVTARWKPERLSSNYPMVADAGGHVGVVFRGQDRFSLFDIASGKMTAAMETCGDADDVFFDAKRRQFYISCGDGFVDVVAATGDALRSLGRVSTSWGARTSLFVPEQDRLFVAERASLIGSNAVLAIYRPATP